MRTSRLQLRSDRKLALAYAIAPLFGAIAAWLIMSLAPLDGGIVRSLFLLPWVMLVGAPVIAVAELLLVTPLVFAFQRYRWGWLNGWSACLIAFGIGAMFGFGYGSIPVAGVQPQLTERIACALLVGVPAVVVALTFRLVAFREGFSSFR